MIRPTLSHLLAITGLCLVTIVGCNSDDDGDNYADKPDAENKGHDHGHMHGPRDGELVELGEEEYHLELTMDDDAKTFAVYVLDKTGKEDVAIKDVPKMEIIEDDENEVVTLKAEPQAGEEEGMSSKYVPDAEGAELEHYFEDLEKHDVKFMVTIEDKEYTGELKAGAHDHGNEEKEMKEKE